MKNVIVAALCLVSISAFATDKAAKVSKDDAIKAFMASFDATMTKHDAKAMAEMMSDDATFVSPMGDGKVMKGKAEIEKAHEAMWAGNGKEMATKHQVDNIRWIGKDHALVDCTVAITGMKMDGPANAPAPTFHATTLMMEKGGKWWMVDARPYMVMPAPAAPAPKS